MIGRALVTAAAIAVAAAALAAAPSGIGWRDAGNHVGEVVTVEGEVTAVHTTADTCVLEFADDPRAFRVVVLVPFFGGAPREPERLYRGRVVRVTGRVQRFQGRPELALRGFGQIETAEASPESRTTAAPTSPPPAPPPPPPPPPPPAPAARPVERPLGDAAPCERARARWREAASDAKIRLEALARCL
ncbi:MAG TPA: hypothetical protein VKA21_15000, partial [Candidatus Binatia bacterium]|nr:hypothetical protein [Candidatus Binatia bacterium]